TAKVAKEVGVITSPDELDSFPEFRDFAHDPKPQLKEALALLESKDATKTQKLIVVIGLQDLPKEDYLVFLEQLLRFFNEGKVSSTVFSLGFFPTWDVNTILTESYKDPKVRALLMPVKKSAKDKR